MRECETCPASRQAVEEAEEELGPGCLLCGRAAWAHEREYDPTIDAPDFSPCCGRYLPTGECCAAIHGEANLLPATPE